MDKLNTRETWWYKYRSIKKRPRDQLSFEMILRKSLKEIFQEYVKHSSLPSIKQIFEQDMPVKHRIMRVIFLGAMFSVVAYCLQYLWFDTLTKPLIVTMDSSTYPISKIDFPAVAICSNNRISRKAIKIVARDIKRLQSYRNESIEDLEWFILQAGRLLDYDYSETIRSHRLLNVVGRSRMNTQALVERMKQLAPDCNEMLLKCTWGGANVNCSSIFTVRRTVRGHCCAFNYVLNFNSAGKPNKTIRQVMRQQRPGVIHGLNIVLDPLLDDYAYPLHPVDGFHIFLFDPTHFADPSGGRMVQRFAQANETLFFELQSIKQVATQEVKKYPLQIRKCLFHDERPDHFGHMYSYSACIVNCRIKTIRSLCKCTPYFLPTAADEGPICTLDDLQCLNKYKEKLQYVYPMGVASPVGLEMELQDSLYCPDCLPDCELTRHVTKSSWIPVILPHRPDKGFTKNFVRGLNMTGRITVSIFQPTGDGVLDRLDVVAYWFEILSNIGGFAGMLIGLSIMCIVEIIYYFFVRLSRVIWSNYRNHY